MRENLSGTKLCVGPTRLTVTHATLQHTKLCVGPTRLTVTHATLQHMQRCNTCNAATHAKAICQIKAKAICQISGHPAGHRQSLLDRDPWGRVKAFRIPALDPPSEGPAAARPGTDKREQLLSDEGNLYPMPKRSTGKTDCGRQTEGTSSD